MMKKRVKQTTLPKDPRVTGKYAFIKYPPYQPFKFTEYQDLFNYLETLLGRWINTQEAKFIKLLVEDMEKIEVCRCRDCVYYKIGDDDLPYCNCPDGGISDYPRPDDFCSYGRDRGKDVSSR